MSRTLHHGRKSRERKFFTPHYGGGFPAEVTPRKRRRSDPPYFWMNTPGYWIREMMTRPQRAETRLLLQRVMRLRDLDDAPLFPLPKKPHVYFW